MTCCIFNLSLNLHAHIFQGYPTKTSLLTKTLNICQLGINYFVPSIYREDGKTSTKLQQKVLQLF
jgi:hypothetical protein